MVIPTGIKVLRIERGLTLPGAISSAGVAGEAADVREGRRRQCGGAGRRDSKAIGLVEEEGYGEGGKEERHAQPRGAEEDAAAARRSGDGAASALAEDADAHLTGGLFVVGDGDGDALDQRRRRRHGRRCEEWGRRGWAGCLRWWPRLLWVRLGWAEHSG